MMSMAVQEIPKIGTLVNDSVKSVSERAVELAGGQSLQYDYLILASGSTYKGKEWEAPELDIAARKAKHQVTIYLLFGDNHPAVWRARGRLLNHFSVLHA